METIEGTVENIIFQSDDRQFCVFRTKCTSLGLVTTVYKGPAPFMGEMIRARGEWTQHARFGRQFSVTGYQSLKPGSAEGMERFLASGAVKGIGKAMASRIVAHFGKDTLDILGKAPERLAEVSGIGAKKAKSIGEAYNMISDLRELMLFLEENGVSGNYAAKLQLAYGDTAITRIKANPYSLITDIDGIGFKTADRIALSLGFEPASEERVRAGIGYALTLAASGGHTCIPEEELLRYASQVLQIDFTDVETVFRKMIANDQLRTEDWGGQRFVYPEYLYRAETGTARMLRALRDHPDSLGKVNVEKIIGDWEAEAGIELAEAQKDAIRSSLKFGVFALTGGPGTGKTTIIKGILSVLKRAGCTVLLAAPTGRAARRLEMAAGDKAQTVHRLLEYTVTGEFGKNADDLLETQAVIVDEASMLDIYLFYHLLEALPLGCRLILVGDVDQLPSVGPGSVLKDIIRCGKMPVVRLQEVFRQAEVSPIVRNAHRINRGLLPECAADSDFSMTEFADEEMAAAYITDLYAAATKSGGWQSLQILSPMHKGPCGVQNLNSLLQDRVNPPSARKEEIRQPGGATLRLGDKVMQIRNNYEKDVYNGDIGQIADISGKAVKVWYPERPDGEYVTYGDGETDELQLAYAMSVHKSQGSEYSRVVLALVPGHYIMLQRNLLYTAVTRAREKVELVGTKTALQTAVANDRTRRRYSLLKERLQESGDL
ncbi:SF1B family DNA helicase RecD2 [Succiniclasticum ruminis]|uniref:ATP-dependent RecD2 DNA helicase n=1 Tax=Succiniclasticum ruminis DSM 9236 TaxID=1123323 RepID=A0A1I1X8J1_9FIRM|nr:ATP-dependent RecD-like DNA helicase [Succiniclasticum ruminis]SFE03736.1 exodeoxyribonuclease V alpha subunit [Succiniclasticum ruminis DSM 9236]